VFIVGQVTGLVVYFRNLQFVRREARIVDARGQAPDDPRSPAR
jgi:lipid-A-disaccharide synthase-like uncharacterized protein